MNGIDWETWLIEDAGHPIVVKKTKQGADALSPVEWLTYCLWVADYGMRNAGDLQTAADLYPPFQSQATQIAEALGLTQTTEAFRLPSTELERTYLDRFDGMCAEISGALGVPPQTN